MDMKIGNSSRQTNLNMVSASSTEDDNKEVRIQRPQLSSRPVKKSADDTRTELGRFRFNNSDDSSSSRERQSVIVKVSGQIDSSDSSESAYVSDTARVAAGSVEVQIQNTNDDVSQSEDLYCSEPNIQARCTLSVIATAATTALGVLIVMKTKGDESISDQATWIGVSALSGLALSSAAGLIHYVYNNIGKPPANPAVTQPA